MRPISSTFFAPLRAGLLVAGLAAGLTQGVLAQEAATPAAPSAPVVRESAPLDGRQNQKIEHISVEDSGARVDELRYGGVTQSISVQPKGAMPGYEVQPTDERRARQGDGSGGPRVWNVLKF